MRNTTPQAIAFTFLATLIALANTSSGQDAKSRDWLRKAEDARATMHDVAKAIRLQAKDLDLSKYDQIKAEIDRALETISDQLGNLSDASDQLDRDTYKKARDTLYEARSELYDVRKDLSKARSEARKKEHEQRDSQKAHEKEEKEAAKKQATNELKVLEDASFQPGSEVIALVGTELKSGTQTVGRATKGEKLTIERIQGDWLYVRNGWLYRRHAIAASMRDWYERLPDRGSVENAGRTRAKFREVTFEILDTGSGPGVTSFGSNSSFRINGQRMDVGDSVTARYKNIIVFVQQKKSGARILGINGAPYGTLQEGDHVFIDASRQVLVNGAPRRRQPGSIGLGDIQSLVTQPRR